MSNPAFLSLPLEDLATDVWNKALSGQKTDAANLVKKSGLPLEKVESVLQGEADPSAIRLLAPFLHLDGEKLLRLAQNSSSPGEVPALDGIQQFNTPFGDMTVNNFLVWDTASKKAVAFDTGADVTDLLDVLQQMQLRLELILLTHAHGDHIYDLDRLQEKTGAPAWIGRGEAFTGTNGFTAGEGFRIGSLTIATRSTSGHSADGITYIVDGLDTPLAIVGDALFASSMGGGRWNYDEALRSNRAEIFTLPDATILCPGHGPVTTVATEKRNNPFFPEL